MIDWKRMNEDLPKRDYRMGELIVIDEKGRVGGAGYRYLPDYDAEYFVFEEPDVEKDFYIAWGYIDNINKPEWFKCP